MASSRPQTQIIFDGRVFRTAGYHHPIAGEIYVSQTGRVVAAKGDDGTGDRLILRCIRCERLGCIGSC